MALGEVSSVHEARHLGEVSSVHGAEEERAHAAAPRDGEGAAGT